MGFVFSLGALMRLRVTFCTPSRVVVTYEPNWLERLFGMRGVSRFANCDSWTRDWFWDLTKQSVPSQVEEAIEQAFVHWRKTRTV